MATTYNDTNGNGSKLEFDYTFPTIEETNTTTNTNSEVKVALDGITQAANRYTVETSPSARIKFNNTNGVDSTVQESSGAPKSNVVVRVYRDSVVDTASVAFAAGTAIRAKDLNTVVEQSLYHSQEQQNQKILAEHIDTGAVTSVKIKDDTIVNADINSAADIVVSKLKDGNAREVLQTGTDGDTVEWTPSVDLSGTLDVAGAVDFDTTLNVDGATTLKDNVTISPGSSGKKLIVNNAAGSETLEINFETGCINSGGLNEVGGDALNLSGNAMVIGNTGLLGKLEVLTNSDGLSVQNASGDEKASIKGATGNIETVGNVTATGSVSAGSITGNAIKTASTSTSNTQVYSCKRAGEIFYGKDTVEEIQSGETWSAADDKVATTAAIDARIIDLVDDVGGFVPIANETSFPNANPDVNNGAGTLISVKTLANDLTSNGSGVATISNGNVGNSATVTINGLANSTTYDAGNGMIVETTTTLHTYTFHRLTPNATEITAVAGKLTEIERLGTTAAVEDMSILGTTDCVADMAILGTTDCVADMAILGTTDVVSDLNTLATTDIVADLDTCATNATNINNVGNNIANVNTVASNLTAVENFNDLYQVDDFDPNPPTTDGGGNALAAGDLAFDSTADELKVYNGSSWQAGVTATGNLVEKSAVTTKGDILVAQGNANPLRLGAGSDGQVLKADSSTASGLTWGADTGLTTEAVQDIVGAMFTGNTETNITATYEDSDGTIDLVTDSASTDFTITNSGTDHWVFTGGGLSSVNDPSIKVNPGQTYKFINNCSANSNPFTIQKWDGSAWVTYSDGVTNNGGQGQTTIEFTPHQDCPAILRYVNTGATNMTGWISTNDPSDGTLTGMNFKTDGTGNNRGFEVVNGALGTGSTESRLFFAGYSNSGSTAFIDAGISSGIQYCAPIQTFKHTSGGSPNTFVTFNNSSTPKVEINQDWKSEGDATFLDNKKVQVGTDGDGALYSDGTGITLAAQTPSSGTAGHVNITTTSGNAVVLNAAATTIAQFQDDLATLYGVVDIQGPDSTNAGTLRLNESNSSPNHVSITVPDDGVTSNYTITLPAAAPTSNGQVLSATTAGAASWVDQSAGTITALNNQTANRLTTIGATTTELDGEANLTFDGSTLAVTGNQTATLAIQAQGIECPAEISADWSIGALNNAMFPGPMTIAANKSVTVPAGRTLHIL